MPPLPPPHRLALLTLLTRLQDLPHPWALTGSTGMALHGLPLAVHDIDLQTDQPGAYAIQQRLPEYILTPVRWVESERIRSHLGLFQIEDIPVELMGALQKRLPDGAWEPPVPVEIYLQVLDFEGFQVPVLSLEYEYRAYLTLGRLDRTELIRRYLPN